MDSRQQLYQDFQEVFSIKRLHEMTLDQYTNLDKTDSFCYWLEVKLESFGSMWGGSSYKFGIYRYKKVPTDTNRMQWDDKYGWYRKYNVDSAQQAFEIVKAAIIKIATCAGEGNYEAIDDIAELGDAYKWKIAFMYSNEKLIPIYKKEWLVDSCLRLGMKDAEKAKISELQRFLIGQMGEKPLYVFADELGDYLWKNTAQRTWIYSPGENACKWDFCVEQSVMCLGWDEMGDFMQYSTREDVKKRMQVVYNKPNSSCKNDSLAVWEFSRIMKEGDIVIAKDGLKKIVGRGIVESDYYCDESLSEYSNCRKVKWTHVGEWNAPQSPPQKTLTDITKFSDYVKELNDLFEKPMAKNTVNDYTSMKHEKYIKLLEANHNIVLSGAPGTGKTYLAKEIAKAMGAKVGFVQFHPSYDYSDFVEGMRPTTNGSFERRDGVFKAFCKKALKNWQDSEKTTEEISVEQRLERGFRLFAEEVQNGEITSVNLRTEGLKMNVIDISEQNVIKLRPQIEGATRTYDVSLRRLAKLSNSYKTIESLNAISNINDAVREAIGGCNSSAYWGVLLQIYKLLKKEKAKETKQVTLKPHVFIIDEINRGEISKIFGELFFSIDPGYRGEDGKVQTQYQNLIDEDDEFFEYFFVPKNVYIIGTMNDIDRSVEPMDFAMRRRFTWVEVKAEESAENMNLPEELAKQMKRLNDAIAKMDGFNESYQLGGAYFLDKEHTMTSDERWQYRIEPLLKEYLRGVANADEELKKLKDAYDEPKAENKPAEAKTEE